MSMIDEYRSRLHKAAITIKELSSKLESAQQRTDERIAVIGVGCRFPGGGVHPEAFWRALTAGVDGVRRVPNERWPAEGIAADRPELRWAGLLDGVDGFDAAFFGISPRESSYLDPQQRLLLEVAWEALERAGQRMDQLLGSKTGVFVGMWRADYVQLVRDAAIDAYSATGSMLSTAAGRVSYTLGLEGPCMIIDTACSSSLVAVHLACQSLRNGESELALAGGVNVLLDPMGIALMLEMSTLSPEGRCRTFDASANGIVAAEGCGVVVLKRLSDAERDGDPILAVIRGSAVNQDGRSAGLTAPNGLSQQAMLRQALENARLSPEDIGYVETHGTGTSLGDPIEFEALRAVLGGPRSDGARCVLGALKTNVGHLDAAAGVAGLIKAILCLENGAIPKNLHFETLNPRISLDGTPFVIPTETLAWPSNGKPRRAGVSAFGLSGTNAHVIVEEAPRRKEAEAPVKEASSYLLALSAKAPDALAALAGAYQDALAKVDARLHDIAYTASVRRSHHEHRLAVVGSSKEEIAEALAAYGRGERPLGLVQGAVPAAAPKVVFVFSGQGSQWVGMGQKLMAEEPVFRASMEACDAALRRHAGLSVIEELGRAPEVSRLGETEVAQPALFALEVALAGLLRSWGVEPEAVVGHSVGEIAAAHVAGMLDLEQAAQLVAVRGRVMQKATGQGKMLAVALGEEEAKRAIEGVEERVGLAAVNAPRQVVLSGETAAIEALRERLLSQGVESRELRVNYAFHSPQMEPCKRELIEALGALAPKAGVMPLFSTVRGERVTGEALDAAYWGANVRQGVRLSEAILGAASLGPTLFVEVGPHPVLTLDIERTLGEKGEAFQAVPTLRRNKDERVQLLSALGRLYVQGSPMGLEKLYPEGGRVVGLPSYPWQRKRYWVETTASWARSGGVPTGHPLLGAALPVAGVEAVFEAVLDLKVQRYLKDHRVFDEVVVPGVALLEMAHAAGVNHGGRERCRVTHFTFQAPLRLSEGTARRVQVVLSETTDDGRKVAVYSQAAEARPEEGWILHATGYVQEVGEEEPPMPLNLEALRARCPSAVAMEEAYERLAEVGLEFGPAFHGLVELWKGSGEALSRLSLPEAAGSDTQAYGVHPSLLDAAVGTGLGVLERLGQQIYLPFEFEAYTRFGEATKEAWAHAQFESPVDPLAETVTASITLADAKGRVIAAMSNVRWKRASAETLLRAETGATTPECVYRLAWQEQPASASERAPSGTWVVLDGGSALSAGLVERLRASGAHVLTATLEALGESAGALVAEAEGLEGVVCLWGERAATDAGASAAEQAEGASVCALGVVQALIGRGTASRLWFVTQGAQAVEAGETVSLPQATPWGLGRVVMAEHPELGCRLVDLDPSGEDGLEELYQELCRPDDEPQIARRAGKRLALRLLAARGGEEAPSHVLLGEGTVLITGGLGALGLRVARWLWQEHRVGHLVLVGRRGAEGEALAEVERLRAEGARVTVAQADVAREREVERVVASVPAEWPLRGVVHAAGVLDDGVLVAQSAARFATVFGPKVRGAWNVHVQTQHLPLQFFVLFSSVSSVVGSAGQGNYAAANAFVDALAQARRAAGLAGQSLNWGGWSEGGMASGLSEALQARGSRLGMGMLAPAQGLALLGQALGRPEAELVLVPLDRRALQRSMGEEVPALLRGLVAAKRERGRTEGKGGWAERLAGLGPAERAVEVATALRVDIAKVLSLGSVSEVPEERALRELGLDSLMAVELRNAIGARVGKALPATLLFDYPTLRSLGRYLLERVLAFDAPTPVAVEPAPRLSPREEAIAIVGIGCRYPGGVQDPETFWRLLEEGVDAIGEVPKERWDIDRFYDPDPDAPGKMNTRWGGFLDDLDRFDPAFFGISPREAQSLDPQQRLLLETTWEALERAGIAAESLLGRDAGVYIGVCSNDYQFLSMSSAERVDAYLGQGTAHSVTAGRISYWLGLQGPNMAVDTACSSSLVSVHLACQALRAGECSLALAGGVNVMLLPELTIYFSRLKAMSPTGRCHTFSADADGYVRGEGCAMVVLKRLSDAERDGDPIVAILRGTAVNQDGRSQGMTAPNGPAQEAVIRRALAASGVRPCDVDYVEAHGTGTPLGDPIEVQALGAVLGEGRAADAPLRVGSVKTNIGHTEGAAGVAGLIKAVVSLQHERIPQSLHFTQPNAYVAWSELPVKVAAEATPWPAQGKTRIAGVSSFGLSGTNAHVIVEEAPRREKPAGAVKEASSYLLALSAKAPEALAALADAYQGHLAKADARLHDIAYTASVRRSHHEHRLAVAGSSKEEIAAALAAYGRGERPLGLVQGAAQTAAPKVVFVFSGQGSQWVGMGQKLLAEEPVFRASLEACDAALRRHAGLSVIEELGRAPEDSRLGETEVAQPALFALEVALAGLLRSWGVEPEAVVGHSVGEIAAAHVAGMLDLEQAAHLVAVRGRVMQKATGQGKMLAVALGEEEAKRAIEGVEDRVGLAAVNAPGQVVLSGEIAAIEEVRERLRVQGVDIRELRVNYAFHSPQMEPWRRELIEVLGALAPKAGKIPLFSTVRGELIAGEALDAAYWGDNVRQTVRLSQAISRAASLGPTLFVEVGPHPVLSLDIEQTLAVKGGEGRVVPTLRRQKDERMQLLSALGSLYTQGHPVQWERLYPEGGRVIELPSYPWQRKRYWVETTASWARSGGVPTGHPLLGAVLPVAGVEAVFEAVLDLKVQRYLKDHRVFDEVVVPGVALLEMAHAAGVNHAGRERCRVTHFTFQAPLRLSEGAARRVQAVLGETTEEGRKVAVYSQAAEARPDEGWILHATGYVQAAGEEEPPKPLNLEALRAQCPSAVAMEEAYERLAEVGLELGPAFHGLVELWKGSGEALSRLSLPEAAGSDTQAYGVHPSLLDAAVGTGLGVLERLGQQVYLPFEFEAYTRFGEATKEAWAHAQFESPVDPLAETVTASITLADAKGRVIAAMSNVRWKRASAETLLRAETGATTPECVYRLAWQEQPASASERAPSGTWVVLDGGSALSAGLVERLRASGAHVLTATLEALGESAGALVAEAEGLEGVVCLWGERAATDAGASAAEQAEGASVCALGVVQALIGRGTASRLWFVTQGAQAVEAGETVSLPQATPWGLGRVVMAEHPELGCRLVDLDPSGEDGLEELYQELCRPDDEPQIARRAGKRLALRLLAARGGEEAPSHVLLGEGTVLITGGLGALGLRVARWLWQEHRVGHLVLVGRRGAEGEALAEVERLRAEGARVTVAQADVAREREVERVVASVPAEWPLRGVVHAAGVLDDGVLVAQSAARFATVFGPKVRGAWNVHVQTQHLPLQFFVLFSSVSSVVGSAGQGNYAAANAFVDALAQARRAAGLAGQSLNWGGWSEGGMASGLSEALQARGSRLGMGMLAPAQGLALLGQALGRPEAELVLVPLDRRALQRSMGEEVPALLRGLVAAKRERGRTEGKGGWAERLAGLGPAERAVEVATALRVDIAKVLSLGSVSEVPEERALRELGLDSLMAVELRNAIGARVGKALPATLLFDYPTLRSLGRYLLERVLAFDAPTPVAVEPAPRLSPQKDAIAIVGLGCRYPGGVRDLAGFWRLLAEGVDAIGEVPKERWDIDAYYDPDPDAAGKMITRSGGFLDAVDRFDPAFFGISPREAQSLDPQQRLLLETTWEALESGGLVAERLMGSDTGVFVGLMYHDYEILSGGTPEAFDGYMATGNSASVASGRISYWLGLKGPSLTLDTACSSSLVAIHLAIQSLRAGECSMALAGGVALMLTPAPYIEMSRLRGLSPDGRCKSFDASADGVAWSEGCGMVVLKRLSDAERDGDRILAVIRGSAVNQDGRSQGLTAPNGPSQEAVIERALAQAGVAASEVDYVEAHGTGTPLGDPIELQALGAVLGEGRAVERPLLVGSAKSNLGHTQAAAGVAGVIKTVLAMQHELIPRSLHFKEPNPRVAWSELAVKVTAEATPWPKGGKARIAGVSSFGISGTNAHMIVEEAPRREKPAVVVKEASSYLLALSAKAPDALVAMAGAYQGHLTSADARLHDIAYTASVRRSHHEHRLAVVGTSKEEIAAALAAYVRGEASLGLVQGALQAAAPKVVFVFPGQGSQWVGMGQKLLAEEPVFRASMEACDTALRGPTGFSVIEELGRAPEVSRLGETEVAQPALFALEVALAGLLRSWGVEPEAVVGHSVGEIAAAHVAGMLDLEQAAHLVAVRGRVMQKATGQGKMLAVALGEEEAKKAIEGVEDRVGLAAVNAPGQVVLSGETAAIEAVRERLLSQGVDIWELRVNYAFHSPQMEPCKRELIEALGDLGPKAGTMPLFSTVRGERVTGEALDAAYWGANVRQVVRLSEAILGAASGGPTLFVEVGPHPVLTLDIERTLGEKGEAFQAVPTLRRNKDERVQLLSALGRLYVQGSPVGFEKLYLEGGCVVDLPMYPWQRERFWIEAGAQTKGASRAARRASEGGAEHPLLGASLSSSAHPGERTWEQGLGVKALPYLTDHRVQGEVVVPGAGYVEMALAAGAATLGAAELVLEDVAFEAMLALSDQGERVVQVVLTEQGAGGCAFQIASRAEEATIWTKHASGRVALRGDEAVPEQAGERPEGRKERLGAGLSSAEHYQRMRERQLDYGPSFQGLLELWVGEGEALGRVRLPEEVNDSGYTLHPALLDACLQVAAALSPDATETYVPVGIRRVHMRARPSRHVWVSAISDAGERTEGGEARCDMRIVDDEGRSLVELEGLQARRLEAVAGETKDALAGCVVEVAWRRVEPLPEAALPKEGVWLVMMDQSGVGAELSTRLSELGQKCVRVVIGAAYERKEPNLYRIDPTKAEDYRRVLREALGEEERCVGAVHLLSLDATLIEDTTAETLSTDLMRGSVSAAYLAQAIVRHGFRDAPRLVLVTRGAQAVVSGEPVAVAQAPLLGLGKTIALEHPELRCTRIDLSPEASEGEAERVVRELAAKDQEDQIALRSEGRYVARLVQSAFEHEEPTAPERRLGPADGRPFRLEIRSPGVLDRLFLQEVSELVPAAGEVLIEVEAAGLNFRDVLLALGVLPDDAAGADGYGPRLGGECAGRVVAVGEGVTEFAPGQEVVASGARAFGSHMLARSALCVLKPARLSWEEAATLPVVLLTAYYALDRVGRLEKGERVLIHAGAGGVGLMAIQWAKHVGAEIFATAGSEEKRAYLRGLGVSHVLDSRSLRFVEEIKSITKGEGVDVVLNSLSGEFIAASLSLLRDHGRFLEIGKRDYYDNKQLGLRPFLRNLSFSLVDLQGLLMQQPERMGALLRELMGLFEHGTLKPLPVRAFPVSRAAEAFAHMAQAKHIGKIALGMKDAEAQIVPERRHTALHLRADRSYLITGGLGGLGLSLARWFVEEGARHLVLVGRRGPGHEAQQAIRAMEEAGAQVECVQADVSRKSEVERLLSRIDESMPPLVGIVHAAAVLDDHTLLMQSEESFCEVFGPKALGAWNLHALCEGRELDFFVMYSSAAALLGSPGQGNYTAANAFLDALSHERARRGLPSMSIQWGAFAEVGLAAASESRGKRLAGRGAASFTPVEGLLALRRLFAHPRAEVGVVRFDARQWIEFYPGAAGLPFLAEAMKDAVVGDGGEEIQQLLKRLKGMNPGERVALLERLLLEQAGSVLRLDPSRMDRLAPLQSLGMDSLTSMELRNRIEGTLGSRLSSTILFTYPSASSLAEHLLERLGITDPSNEAEVKRPTLMAASAEHFVELERSLDELSDEQLIARLADQLDSLP